MKRFRITSMVAKLIPWGSEQLYFDNSEYFASFISELNKATKSIDIECYIFGQDELGRSIIRALLAASLKGVRVRVIIDGLGSMDWQLEQINELTNAGIAVKVYHPLPWHLSLFKELKFVGGFISKLVYLFSHINKRDHRKLFIIDSISAWSGSLNLSGTHLGMPPAVKPWFDCGLNVSGDLTSNLTACFDEVWHEKINYARGKKQLPFRTNNNIIRRKKKNFELTRLIRSSQIRVWIICAYLVPSKPILRAIKQAKKNGADVKILISNRSDIIFFPLVSTVFYHELLNAGIEIFEYQDQIIHAKSILLDKILILGSSNLDYRSFLHDLELDIILKQSASLTQMASQFERLIENAERVSQSSLNSRPWYARWISKFYWELRYWL